jgi:serine/threonine protein kinase
VTSKHPESDGSAFEDGLVPWSIDKSSLPVEAGQRLQGEAPSIPSVGVWVGPAEDPARYEVLDVVGAGAEGTTYRAQYRARPQAPAAVVAVKRVHPPRNADGIWPHDGSWTAISHQYRVLAGVRQNPHLVDTREVFLGSISSQPNEMFPFIVMDWIEGRSPLDLLSDTHPAPLQQRFEWVLQLAVALRALHAVSHQAGHAMVHGDVKPSNCLVTAQGQLVLLDLGAATHAAEPLASGLHTPQYAAPEVITAPLAPRQPSGDIYSLAATAFFFLTAQAPPARTSPVGRSEAATRILMRSPHLRRIGGRRRRRRLAEALLGPLTADAQHRAGVDGVAWAERLQTFTPARRQRRHRRGALAVLALGVAALTTAWMTQTGPFQPSIIDVTQAYNYDTKHVAWNELPESPKFPDLEDDVTFGGDRGWSNWPTPAVDSSGNDGQDDAPYVIQASDPAGPTVIGAPEDHTSTREIIRVSGRTSAGQGAWGVWCRGSDAAGTRRYQFLLSHAGAVGIFEADETAGVTLGPGTDFWYVDGVDFRKPVTMDAECADADGGVVLSLRINDREVLRYSPVTVLGPSTSGLVALRFGDLSPTATPISAQIDQFIDASAAPAS